MGGNLRRVACVAALLTLAACGSSAPKGGRGSARVDISTWRAGTESGTVKITSRSRTVSPGQPDQVEVSNGAVDFDHQRYVSKSRIASGRFAGREFETRQIGDTAYWWDPSPDGPGGTAKPWSRADLPWQAGTWATTLDRAFTNPRATVTPTGTETVRGTEVTNYRMTYPPRVPPRLLARGYPQGLTGLEIAVDADQRARRIRFSLRTTSDSVTHEEMEFHDDGVPVTVDPPPADQIDTSGASPGRPVATGPWTDLATDTVGSQRVVVSAIPTQDGTCFAVSGVPDSIDWWTVAGEPTTSCARTGELAMGPAEADLTPVSTDAQILTGQFDRAVGGVTLHLDDGSEITVKSLQGGFAAIVRGDHVVERIDAAALAGTATCDFTPDQPFLYRCSSSVFPPGGAPSTPSFTIPSS